MPLRRIKTLQEAILRHECTLEKESLHAVGVDIDIIGHLPRDISQRVKSLFISNNNLRSLKFIEQFTELEILSVSNNDVQYLEDLFYLKYLPKIRKLLLLGNLVTKIPFYFDFILGHCPHLEKLDGLKITDEARERAKVNFIRASQFVSRALSHSIRNTLLLHIVQLRICHAELFRTIFGKFRFLHDKNIDHTQLNHRRDLTEILSILKASGLFKYVFGCIEAHLSRVMQRSLLDILLANKTKKLTTTSNNGKQHSNNQQAAAIAHSHAEKDKVSSSMIMQDEEVFQELFARQEIDYAKLLRTAESMEVAVAVASNHRSRSANQQLYQEDEVVQDEVQGQAGQQTNSNRLTQQVRAKMEDIIFSELLSDNDPSLHANNERLPRRSASSHNSSNSSHSSRSIANNAVVSHGKKGGMNNSNSRIDPAQSTVKLAGKSATKTVSYAVDDCEDDDDEDDDDGDQVPPPPTPEVETGNHYREKLQDQYNAILSKQQRQQHVQHMQQSHLQHQHMKQQKVKKSSVSKSLDIDHIYPSSSSSSSSSAIARQSYNQQQQHAKQQQAMNVRHSLNASSALLVSTTLPSQQVDPTTDESEREDSSSSSSSSRHQHHGSSHSSHSHQQLQQQYRQQQQLQQQNDIKMNAAIQQQIEKRKKLTQQAQQQPTRVSFRLDNYDQEEDKEGMHHQPQQQQQQQQQSQLEDNKDDRSSPSVNTLLEMSQSSSSSNGSSSSSSGSNNVSSSNDDSSKEDIEELLGLKITSSSSAATTAATAASSSTANSKSADVITIPAKKAVATVSQTMSEFIDRIKAMATNATATANADISLLFPDHNDQQKQQQLISSYSASCQLDQARINQLHHLHQRLSESSNNLQGNLLLDYEREGYGCIDPLQADIHGNSNNNNSLTMQELKTKIARLSRRLLLLQRAEYTSYHEYQQGCQLLQSIFSSWQEKCLVSHQELATIYQQQRQPMIDDLAQGKRWLAEKEKDLLEYEMASKQLALYKKQIATDQQVYMTHRTAIQEHTSRLQQLAKDYHTVTATIQKMAAEIHPIRRRIHLYTVQDLLLFGTAEADQAKAAKHQPQLGSNGPRSFLRSCFHQWRQSLRFQKRWSLYQQRWLTSRQQRKNRLYLQSWRFYSRVSRLAKLLATKLASSLKRKVFLYMKSQRILAKKAVIFQHQWARRKKLKQSFLLFKQRTSRKIILPSSQQLQEEIAMNTCANIYLTLRILRHWRSWTQSQSQWMTEEIVEKISQQRRQRVWVAWHGLYKHRSSQHAALIKQIQQQTRRKYLLTHHLSHWFLLTQQRLLLTTFKRKKQIWLRWLRRMRRLVSYRKRYNQKILAYKQGKYRQILLATTKAASAVQLSRSGKGSLATGNRSWRKMSNNLAIASASIAANNGHGLDQRRYYLQRWINWMMKRLPSLRHSHRHSSADGRYARIICDRQHRRVKKQKKKFLQTWLTFAQSKRLIRGLRRMIIYQRVWKIWQAAVSRKKQTDHFVRAASDDVHDHSQQDVERSAILQKLTTQTQEMVWGDGKDQAAVFHHQGRPNHNANKKQVDFYLHASATFTKQAQELLDELAHDKEQAQQQSSHQSAMRLTVHPDQQMSSSHVATAAHATAAVAARIAADLQAMKQATFFTWRSNIHYQQHLQQAERQVIQITHRRYLLTKYFTHYKAMSLMKLRAGQQELAETHAKLVLFSVPPASAVSNSNKDNNQPTTIREQCLVDIQSIHPLVDLQTLPNLAQEHQLSEYNKLQTSNQALLEARLLHQEKSQQVEELTVALASLEDEERLQSLALADSSASLTIWQRKELSLQAQIQALKAENAAREQRIQQTYAGHPSVLDENPSLLEDKQPATVSTMTETIQQQKILLHQLQSQDVTIAIHEQIEHCQTRKGLLLQEHQVLDEKAVKLTEQLQSLWQERVEIRTVLASSEMIFASTMRKLSDEMYAYERELHHLQSKQQSYQELLAYCMQQEEKLRKMIANYEEKKMKKQNKLLNTASASGSILILKSSLQSMDVYSIASNNSSLLLKPSGVNSDPKLLASIEKENHRITANYRSIFVPSLSSTKQAQPSTQQQQQQQPLLLPSTQPSSASATAAAPPLPIVSTAIVSMSAAANTANSSSISRIGTASYDVASSGEDLEKEITRLSQRLKQRLESSVTS